MNDSAPDRVQQTIELLDAEIKRALYRLLGQDCNKLVEMQQLKGSGQQELFFFDTIILPLKLIPLKSKKI